MKNLILLSLLTIALLFGCRDSGLEDRPSDPPQTTERPPVDPPEEMDFKTFAGLTLEELEATAPDVGAGLRVLCGEKYEDLVIPITSNDGNFTLTDDRWLVTQGEIRNEGALYQSIIVIDSETGMQYAALFESDSGQLFQFEDSDDLPEPYQTWISNTQ